MGKEKVKPLVVRPLVPVVLSVGKPVLPAEDGFEPSRFSRRLLTPSLSKSPLAVRADPVIPYCSHQLSRMPSVEGGADQGGKVSQLRAGAERVHRLSLEDGKLSTMELSLRFRFRFRFR